MMKLLRSLALAGLLLPAVALAATPPLPLLSGPQDPSQLNATINNLILQINAILSPLIPTVSGAVNVIALTPAATGGQATIGLQSGADTNASITINPNGSGNIILFGQTDTGVFQLANQTSWVQAQGLAACPAVSNGPSRPLGVAATVQGYFLMQDWLGRSHAVPGC